MKTKLLCLLIVMIICLQEKSEATITFNYLTPPSNANICEATAYKIGFYDVLVSDFPLTVNLTEHIKQGSSIISLIPFPDCGLNIQSSGVSPVQLDNGTILNATCPLLISGPTYNQGIRPTNHILLQPL